MSFPKQLQVEIESPCMQDGSVETATCGRDHVNLLQSDQRPAAKEHTEMFVSRKCDSDRRSGVHIGGSQSSHSGWHGLNLSPLRAIGLVGSVMALSAVFGYALSRGGIQQVSDGNHVVAKASDAADLAFEHSRDLVELRRQLAELRQELAAMRANGMGPRSNDARSDTGAATQDVTEVTPPRRDEAAWAEWQASRRAYVEELNAQFQLEPRDAKWASSATAAIHTSAEKYGFAPQAVRSVDCRSNTCRVELSQSDLGESERNLPNFLAEVAAVLPNADVDNVVQQDGKKSLVLYMKASTGT